MLPSLPLCVTEIVAMPAVAPDAAVVAVVAAGVLAVVAEAAEELEVLPPPPQPAIARATMPVTPRTPTFDLFMESSDSVVEVQPRGRLRETILPVVCSARDPPTTISTVGERGALRESPAAGRPTARPRLRSHLPQA